ncbi:MAG: NnrU family protein [Lentilitoribacter sp.]
MTVLIIGLLGFHGLHSIRMVAPHRRQKMIKKLGEGVWKGGYSVATFLFLVMIVLSYRDAQAQSDILWQLPEWGRHVAFLFMLCAFILIPFNMRSSRFRYITHHPFLLAIVFWSSAHLLVRSDTASVLLFGSFLLWALINWVSNKRRGGEIPPIAPLYIDLIAIVGGVIAWFLFFMFGHEWLFGISPIGASL